MDNKIVRNTKDSGIVKKDLTGKQILLGFSTFIIIIGAVFAIYIMIATRPTDDTGPWENYTAGMIILDLDGNGVNMVLTSLDASVPVLGMEEIFFDHRNNGFGILTEWPEEYEGILVCDLDGDGKITSGAELFGPDSLIGGENGGSGIEVLKSLDSNKDGKIDAEDLMFQ